MAERNTASNKNSASEPKVLLVDDNTTNLQLLHETLDGLGYKLLIAKNGPTALRIAQKAGPSLILLDIMMPEMDGYEVCRRLKADSQTSKIPVIFITALADEEDEAKGLGLGAVDYITKPVNPELVRARVHNHLELKRYQDHLETLVAVRTRRLALTQAVTIESLATLAEYRDPETGGHIKRTQNYVKALAVRLKNHPRFREELSDEVIDLLYLSAPLHDLGKVGVRDNVLLKPGRLDPDEFETMKTHTTLGHELLNHLMDQHGAYYMIQMGAEVALSHHEWWDGGGYPLGWRGQEIPLSARIVALTDVYDALTSKRIYKEAWDHQEAINAIRGKAGTQFDPQLTELFLSNPEELLAIRQTYPD